VDARLPLRVVALILSATACATSPSFAGNVYRDSTVAYRIGSLPEGWERTNLPGSNLSFHHTGGGSILVNAVCRDLRDLSLDVLTNQALFGVEEKHELSRQPVTLDGRGGLRTRLDGAMDGVPMSLELVLVKKDGCVHDFLLAAGRDVFPARTAAFEALVAGFQREPGSTP
jgi:hypothetical protein